VQCLLYFSSTYPSVSLAGKIVIFYLQLTITQIFMLDFVLNWYLKHDVTRFLLDFMTYLDLITMIPVYLELGMKSGFPNAIQSLECLRILRIPRVLRTWKYTANLSSVGRQITELVLTLIYLVFLAATAMHLMEGAVYQLSYKCHYSTEKTGWLPSCDPSSPASPTCDCKILTCSSMYSVFDSEGQPSLVTCQNITFFEAIYFIVITTFSVGYGDISASSTVSKIVIVAYILLSLVIFPMRISELQRLLTNASPYLAPYLALSGQTHVIITGATDDKKKLEHILKELFHPDRTAASKEDLHVVLLSSSTPTEEVRSLIGTTAFESKVTWIVGTALSVADLKKARADSALAMFFLCNSHTTTQLAATEDASIVLQALSVTNFNMELECLVQVLRPESSKSFIENDISVVLCLDEFKTLVQARNAVVPGFSTVVENLFHSFGTIDPEIRNSLPPWYHEYLRGAGMELYFTEIPFSFIRLMRFSFKRIAVAILLEFDCIALGVSNEAQTGVVFNPRRSDLVEFSDVVDFFDKNHHFLIMADDQQEADNISRKLEDVDTVERILQMLSDHELLVPCGINKPAWASAEKYSKTKGKMKPAPAKKLSAHNSRFGVFPTTSTDTDEHAGGKIGNRDYNDSDESSDDQSESSDESTDSEFSQGDDDTDDSDIDEENYIGYKKESFGKKQIMDDDDFDFTILPTRSRHSSPTTSPKLRKSVKPKKERYESSDSSSSSDSEKESHPEFSSIAKHMLPTKLGLPSAEIRDALNIKNHVIVGGCEENLQMFITELRRPVVVGALYHPVVIVSEETPKRWHFIKERFNDVYFHKGSIANLETLRLINAKEAFSVTIMAARKEVLMVDDQHVNPGTLLAYLAIESSIPKQVHISVEITNPVNIAVMNATIVRRERDNANKSHSAESVAEKTIVGSFATRRKSNMSRLSITGTDSTRPVSAEQEGGGMVGDLSAAGTGAKKIMSSLGSSVEKIMSEAREVVKHQISGPGMEMFWDAMDSHHVLPVFASGTAYIPSCFESLLVSNWFTKITPILCEKFIVGQNAQSFCLVSVPKNFIGKPFVDIFRVFLSNNALCIGIFRSASKVALLPYVYLSPSVSVNLVVAPQLSSY